VTAGRELPSHHGLFSIVVTVVTVVVVVLIVVVVVIVVVVENVGVTGQRNVARGELAARPVSLTRPGTDFVADPFAASHFLSLSLSLYPPCLKSPLSLSLSLLGSRVFDSSRQIAAK